MTHATSPYALVVDDDPLVLLVACDILGQAGFRFFEAGSVNEALAVLTDKAQCVTLLFTDVEMPGEANGFHLARQVADRWPEIEIVVASGRVAPDPGDMPDRATFLSKPFSAQVVHDHFRQILPDGKKPPALRSAT